MMIMILSFVAMNIVVAFWFPFCLMWSLYFFKQKTAYEMRISDWRSDVCSSDLVRLIMKRAKRGTHVVYIPGNHDEMFRQFAGELGRASCRERVCQYV